MNLKEIGEVKSLGGIEDGRSEVGAKLVDVLKRRTLKKFWNNVDNSLEVEKTEELIQKFPNYVPCFLLDSIISKFKRRNASSL